jgi:hypothetical protein
MDPLHECGHQFLPDESMGTILFAFALKGQDTSDYYHCGQCGISDLVRRGNLIEGSKRYAGTHLLPNCPAACAGQG